MTNTKVIQAFIQAVLEVVTLVERADTLAQSYKAKYQAINPDLTGTNLTPAQLSALNTWVQSLHSLAIDAVVTVAKNKTQPSHGTGALN